MRRAGSGTRPRRRDGGAVLLTVLLVMVGLMGMGITGLWLTGANMQMGANMGQRQLALYLAEAGVEHARSVLTAANRPPLNNLLQGSTPSKDNVPTGVDSTSGLPNGMGAILIDTQPSGATVPLLDVPFPTTASSDRSGPMGTYTVWVRNDTTECRRAAGGDGSVGYTTDANNAVVVRSMGLSADGRTQVVLEVTMGALTSGGGGGGGGGATEVLCAAGKNACDDNSSTWRGLVAN